MSFLVGRDGKISVVRTGTLAALLGILLVGAGVLAFVLDTNSYKSPLDVALYAGAEEWGQQSLAGASRTIIYRIPATSPEEVSQFYQQKLTEQSGERDNRCVRNPPAGNFPDAANNRNAVPYEYKCVFERSGLSGGSHSTIVTIQPGLANSDPTLDSSGMTLVRYEQRWEP